MATRRFRSDKMRDIYDAARKQGFKPVQRPGSGHAYLKCPTCPHVETISITSAGDGRAARNQLANLRRHGLTYNGRGGKHAAPLPDETETEKGSP